MYVLVLTETWVGIHFWRFFSQTHLVTLLSTEAFVSRRFFLILRDVVGLGMSVANRVTRLGECSPFWAIVFFGLLFEKQKVVRKFGLLLSTVKVIHILLLTKNLLGHILGDFWSPWLQQIWLCANF
jgi:branched-subunit amino acid transport protein